MSHHKPSSNQMLDTYLYATDSVADRLTANTGRVIRCNRTESAPVMVDKQKSKDKQDAAAFRKLDREMKRLTNPALLCDARKHQEGQPQPPRPQGCETDQIQGSQRVQAPSLAALVIDRRRLCLLMMSIAYISFILPEADGQRRSILRRLASRVRKCLLRCLDTPPEMCEPSRVELMKQRLWNRLSLRWIGGTWRGRTFDARLIVASFRVIDDGSRWCRVALQKGLCH